jgi:hypothetical protein
MAKRKVHREHLAARTVEIQAQLALDTAAITDRPTATDRRSAEHKHKADKRRRKGYSMRRREIDPRPAA